MAITCHLPDLYKCIHCHAEQFPSVLFEWNMILYQLGDLAHLPTNHLQRSLYMPVVNFTGFLSINFTKVGFAYDAIHLT